MLRPVLVRDRTSSSSFVYHSQMSNSVSSSHALVSGLSWKRPASEGGLYRGQVLIICSADCSGSPHSHAALSADRTGLMSICSFCMFLLLGFYGGNPGEHGENMQTPHRKAREQAPTCCTMRDLNPQPSCCEATVLRTEPP